MGTLRGKARKGEGGRERKRKRGGKGKGKGMVSVSIVFRILDRCSIDLRQILVYIDFRIDCQSIFDRCSKDFP